MGIRFLCHHCEKRLNVKQTQAGTEGVCPNCSGTILVPHESTIPSELEKRKHEIRNKHRVKSIEGDNPVGLHDVDEQATMDGLPAERRQSNFDEPSVKIKQAVSESMLMFDSNEDSTELFMLDKPKPPESFGKVDPIAEAPDRIWYFRSHELGERGPLKGKVMQEFLDNGDVKVGCVVWRDDWEDWIEAEKAFPSLVAAAKSQRKKAYVERALREANVKPKVDQPKGELFTKQRVFYGAIGTGILLIIVLLFVAAKVISGS